MRRRPTIADAELTERAQDEGRAALDAAGIDYHDDTVNDLPGRMERLGVADIAGRARAGSSSWQSLKRGTGAIETDYLNGEIVLHRAPARRAHAGQRRAVPAGRRAGAAAARSPAS